MFRKLSVIWFLFLIFAVATQGCSGGSSSSDPTGSDDVDEDGWSTQLVKSGNFANGEINLSIDADCNLFVSAYELNTGLQYITNKSGSWVSALIAEDEDNNAGYQNDITVDPSGKVHMIYSSLDGVYYATDESGSWSSEELWGGGSGSCCIVADGGGNLHSAFDESNNWDIRYVYKPAGGAWGTNVPIDDEWVNSACDIDFDSSDNPHVIFNFSGHHNLRYAFLSGSWTVSTIEGVDAYPYEPDTGWTPSIAVNKSTDAVNIVFWNSTDNSVQFSNGAAYSAVTLKETSGWSRPCIALDNEGYAHIFFHDYGTSDLFYITNITGDWVTTTLPMEAGGDELAVGIDTENMIHLIYPKYSDTNLYHASFQL